MERTKSAIKVRCGAELKEDAKFCPYCGTPVGAEMKVRSRPKYAEERAVSVRGVLGEACGVPYPLRF